MIPHKRKRRVKSSEEEGHNLEGVSTKATMKRAKVDKGKSKSMMNNGPLQGQSAERQARDKHSGEEDILVS
jgi:hypothetical protein